MRNIRSYVEHYFLTCSNQSLGQHRSDLLALVIIINIDELGILETTPALNNPGKNAGRDSVSPAQTLPSG
jgi:hypothetical protein